MELQQIELENLKPTNVNVRKKGGNNIADLLPSIRSLGVLQPLLVRPNCDGFEVVAGQRRYNTLVKLAEEGIKEPVPCIIMAKGDDATAIEASLAENVARLPMDEIDQYKAFSALIKQGRSVDDIASDFGITERLVNQRLAIANLIAPVLKFYTQDDIGGDTMRILTMATKRQQKAWVALHNSETDRTPFGHHLKSWLFGGAEIPLQNALFDVGDYKGATISDLFGEESYFDDATKFWEMQNAAIATQTEQYIKKGWNEIVILDVGEHWSEWEHTKTTKKNGGKVYVQIHHDGTAEFHEGYLTKKEAKQREKTAQGIEVTNTQKAEISNIMQNYLGVHRHSAVRTELLAHHGIALRLAVAQIIAGSDIWSVKADPQKASNEAIAESLKINKAETVFNEERQRVLLLLGMADTKAKTIVPTKGEWERVHNLPAIFAKLIGLDDASVNLILTFVVAETLPSGSALVEILGNKFDVDMADYWQPDQAFFDLLRDKATLNAILKQLGGKVVADAHIASTAKVQKNIIQDYIAGERTGKKDWQPDYMGFPMKGYTKRGGIRAIDEWKAIKKHFA